MAVGGGVVTDVAGFAAAAYHRGVPVVHVATTLLAQVDAAIGGKTGVNLPEGKNLVGAFWQPAAVLCDTEVLESLPPEEYRSGLGEMAKYAFLGAEGLADLPLAERVARCVEIKAAVVAADEREAGQRAVLNYGHTLAHALETHASDIGADLRHGEAVAIGLVFAALLARRLGRIDDERVEDHRRVVDGYGLPAELPAGADAEPADRPHGEGQEGHHRADLRARRGPRRRGRPGRGAVRRASRPGRHGHGRRRGPMSAPPCSSCCRGRTSTCWASGSPRSTDGRRWPSTWRRPRRRPKRQGLVLEHTQSNHEGGLVDAVHEARGRAAAIVINAGALTHYAWSLHDALASFDGVVVELHLSQPNAREPWRHTSVVAPVADGSIAGFGGLGYELAVDAVARILAAGPEPGRP